MALRVPPLMSRITGFRHRPLTMSCVAVASRQLHGRAAPIEDVEIVGLGAAPAVTQIPDQGVGVLELALDEVFEKS